MDRYCQDCGERPGQPCVVVVGGNAKPMRLCLPCSNHRVADGQRVEKAPTWNYDLGLADLLKPV